jgi:CubicO group peptidase (beta-lactamase class C family)
LLALISTFPAIMTSSTNRAYSQPNQMNFTAADSSADIQNTSEKIVQAGDVDIAYKMFGNGEPIVLISGGSADKMLGIRLS